MAKKWSDIRRPLSPEREARIAEWVKRESERIDAELAQQESEKIDNGR